MKTLSPLLLLRSLDGEKTNTFLNVIIILMATGGIALFAAQVALYVIFSRIPIPVSIR